MHSEACWRACAKHYNVCVAGTQPAAIFNHLQKCKLDAEQTRAKMDVGDKYKDAATSLFSTFSMSIRDETRSEISLYDNTLVLYIYCNIKKKERTKHLGKVQSTFMKRQLNFEHYRMRKNVSAYCFFCLLITFSPLVTL